MKGLEGILNILGAEQPFDEKKEIIQKKALML